MSKILKLNTLRPEKALDNLNRVTGLDFDSWPESLVNHAETQDAQESAPQEKRAVRKTAPTVSHLEEKARKQG
ncbi:MAG: hypothetical protein CL537_05675 [Alcanivoracaceae bacterium]|uniref:hypothetical protein n=1 Tax=Alcanivorax sp. MD8A TaxID=1177157 RepID=UPI000C59DEE0|nr:hypothetical protein [Alcanivorax sp. MD8A]MAX54987.1 hypothetical protein [Alcanivoracaceae bacterium]MCG8438094.1 hypothetical protein [Pseudomonadales bacterium]MEE2869313.1 hypothetical protein [Pseudomonadota bacterium]PNE02705.1 hypothetical protein A15D_01745 [Alcanivorax sp. MD8A]|tara:strand:- start:7964 stop:8182 length:219 start_codon:yes stop_codon:yes gene_type:complete